MCKNEIIVKLTATEEISLKLCDKNTLLLAGKVLVAKYLTWEEGGEITKVKDINKILPSCDKTPIDLF